MLFGLLAAQFEEVSFAASAGKAADAAQPGRHSDLAGLRSWHLAHRGSGRDAAGTLAASGLGMAKKEELTGRFSSWASHAVAQSQLGIALLLLPLLACVVLWGSFRARAPIAGGWGEDAQTGSQADQWSVSVFARGAGNESESLEAAGIAGVNRRWGPVGSEMGAGEARKVAVEATRETSREGEARESTASLKAIDGQAEGVDGGEEAEGEGIVGSVEGGGVKERGEGQGKGRESAGDAARGGEDSVAGARRGERKGEIRGEIRRRMRGERRGERGDERTGEGRRWMGGERGREKKGGEEEGGQEGEDLLVGCEEMMNEGLSDSSGGEEGGEGGEKESGEGGGEERPGDGNIREAGGRKGSAGGADAGGVRVGSNARDKRSGGRDESNSGGGSSGGSSGDSSGGAKGVVYGSEIGGARNGDGGGDAKGDSNGGNGRAVGGVATAGGARKKGGGRKEKIQLDVPLSCHLYLRSWVSDQAFLPTPTSLQVALPFHIFRDLPSLTCPLPCSPSPLPPSQFPLPLSPFPLATSPFPLPPCHFPLPVSPSPPFPLQSLSPATGAHGSPTPALLCSQATHAQHFPFPSPLSHCSPSHLLSGCMVPLACDLYRGSWVPDTSPPLYTNATCPNITRHQNCQGNGRPDSQYERWQWRPEGAACALPRFDAEEFMRVMRGRGVLFVGDSVARNHFESLVCLLSQVENPEFHGGKSMLRLVFRSSKVTLARVNSAWLVEEGNDTVPDCPDSIPRLHLDRTSPKWFGEIGRFDVVMFSSAHWFVKPSIYMEKGEVIGSQGGWWKRDEPARVDNKGAFAIAIRTVFRDVVKELGKNPNRVFIYRTFSPDHYEKGEWNTGGSCAGLTEPRGGNYTYSNTFGLNLYTKQLEAYNEVIEAAIEAGASVDPLRFTLMDVMPSAGMRVDGHPGPYRGLNAAEELAKYKDSKFPPPQDCLHWGRVGSGGRERVEYWECVNRSGWCLPGPIDSWNVFLLQIVKRGVVPMQGQGVVEGGKGGGV
ncbi:unnamed protein product [Closterium sp. NIES-64]|nr:unnamed protein product [Closterium sp. NIES-64]